MKYVEGKILTPSGFKKGYVGYKKNKIEEKGNGKPPEKPICEGLIVPTFVNTHTHIADSFIRKKEIDLPRDLEKLVAPPDGIKHRMLRETHQVEIVEGMEESIESMIKTGVKHFCDFRENGIIGICELKTALKYWPISSTILSRPKKMEYNQKEISLLLRSSDGIGLSSISDWDYSTVKRIAEHVKKEEKILALHASERVREDIDKILDLKPDFLIHMVKATEEDLQKVRDENVAIVLCPRSNLFFDLKPDYSKFKIEGLDLMLGSDNCMINSPNIIEEVRCIKNQTESFTLEDLLKMATYTPRKVLNLRPSILALNSSVDFVVLDENTLEPILVS